MRKTRLALTSLVAVLSLGLAACASGGGGGGDMEEAPEALGDQVAIAINNDIMPGETVTVWIIPDTGSRQRLGTVRPSGRATFRFSPTTANQNFRLRAEIQGGDTRTSNPFDLAGAREVRWDVSDVNVRVSGE